MCYPYVFQEVRKRWMIVLFTVCCANSVLAAIHEPENTGTQSNLGLVVFPTKCVEDLGCFYTGPPFYDPKYRPISLEPNDAPNTTVLLLYTPNNKQNPTILRTTNESLETSPLDTTVDTKFVLHGYIQELPPSDIFFDIVDELVDECSCNVILVNYSGSTHFTYPQAVANARVVAAQVAKFINFHVERRGLNPKNVHLIGHSLGGHTIGWIGERVPGVARATGLDPAGPYFQHAEDKVRLDITDADFVDIIHTNSGDNIIEGLGLYQAIGHLDFYPNGGNTQPGCPKIDPFDSNEPPYEQDEPTAPLDSAEAVPEDVIHTNGDNNIQHALTFSYNSCSHGRCKSFFLESIRHCHFIGVKCNSYEDYLNGICTSKNSLTAEMGYHATKVQTPPENSRFFLRTTSKPPFCIED